MDLLNLMESVPQLLICIPMRTLKPLRASCRRCRRAVERSITGVAIELLERKSEVAYAKLLASGRWTGLKRLRLVQFRDGGVIQSLCQVSWPLLQILVLAEFRASDVRFPKVSTPASWPSLTSLIIVNVALAGETAAEYLTSTSLPKLQSLTLHLARLEVSALTQLVKGQWPCLTHLDLSCNDFPTSALAQFKKASWPLLEWLDLQGALVAEDKMLLSSSEAIAAAQQKAFHDLAQSQWPRLVHLNLDSCNLNPQNMRELCQAPWSCLADLNLTSSCLAKEALSHLVKAEWLHLSSLHMNFADLDCQAMQHFAQGQWPCLRYLNQCGNNLDVHALDILFTVDLPVVSVIDISRNYLGPHRIVRLADGKYLPLAALEQGVHPSWLQKRWPNLMQICAIDCMTKFND